MPLLLNSFGEGDGHGVYQLVEGTILGHPENVVVPALIDGLQNRSGSVTFRYELANCGELSNPRIDRTVGSACSQRRC